MVVHSGPCFRHARVPQVAKCIRRPRPAVGGLHVKVIFFGHATCVFGNFFRSRRGKDGPRQVLLSKDTESEGIIITSGSCDLTDPSFSNAAERLAGLEIDVQDAALHRTSPPSSRGRSRGSLAAGSSKSLRTSSTRSLASISENAASYRSGNNIEFEEPLRSLDSGPSKSDLDATGSSGEFTYMSPFGCPDAQQELADEHERLEIAEDKSMGNLWGGQQSSGQKSLSEEAGRLRKGAWSKST